MILLFKAMGAAALALAALFLLAAAVWSWGKFSYWLAAAMFPPGSGLGLVVLLSVFFFPLLVALFYFCMRALP